MEVANFMVSGFGFFFGGGGGGFGGLQRSVILILFCWRKVLLVDDLYLLSFIRGRRSGQGSGLMGIGGRSCSIE